MTNGRSGQLERTTSGQLHFKCRMMSKENDYLVTSGIVNAKK